MSFQSAFSTDYESARNGFRQLSQQLTDRIEAYPVMPEDQNLTIDVAQIGDPEPKNTLIITSGLHGVEGLVGSAIQFAFLRNLIDSEIDLKVAPLY